MRRPPPSLTRRAARRKARKSPPRNARHAGVFEGGVCEMVLLERIELSTSPLPRVRSTTELQQRSGRPRADRRGAGAAYGGAPCRCQGARLDEAEISRRSEEHTSELQSLMRISYAVFCLKKKNV